MCSSDLGIPSRTLPGVGGKGAFFTRGSGHNLNAAYTEDSAEYKAVLDRIKLKLDTAANAVPEPEIRREKGADIGVICLGSTRGAVLEAMDLLKAQGIAADFMRLKGFPFGNTVREFLESHERIFVVEQNQQGQMRSMLMIETNTPPEKLIAVLDYAGLPLTAKVVVDAVTAQVNTPAGAR